MSGGDLVADLREEAIALHGAGIDRGSVDASMSGMLADAAADEIERLSDRAIAAERERDEAVRQRDAAHSNANRLDISREALAARLAAIRAILARYERHRCRIVDEIKEVMGDE